MFLLVPAYPGSPDKRPLNGCVCVCVLDLMLLQLCAAFVGSWLLLLSLSTADACSGCYNCSRCAGQFTRYVLFSYSQVIYLMYGVLIFITIDDGA